MDVRRLILSVGMRWRAILVLALLGALTALGFALLRNSNIEASYRAVAPLAVAQTADQPGPQTGQSLTESAANAEAALRRENSEALVEVDEGRAALLFVGFGPTADSAAEIATAARQTYLDVVPMVELPTIDQQLAEIVEEAEDVQRQLGALNPSSTLQPADRARQNLLTAELEALRQRAATLTLQLVRGEGDEEAIEEELEEIEARSIDLEQGLAALQEQNARRESAETSLVRRALEREYQALEAHYQELYLQREEAAEAESEPEPVQVFDETPVRTSPALSALIGLLGGAALGLGGLMVEDRVRRPLWSEADLKGLPVLAELPRRAREPHIWYPLAGASTRKSGIQSLRAAVQGARARRGVSRLLLAGLGTHQSHVHMLAADLATSTTLAGESVLLLDTDFDAPSELPEYDRSGGPSLAEMLSGATADDDEDFVSVKRALSERSEPIPGLKAMSAGLATDEPVDALAGDMFQALLEAAADSATLVIAAAPEIGHPITNTLERRMDGLIVVCTQGRTSLADVEEVARSSVTADTALLGVVILTGRPPTEVRRRTHASHLDKPDDAASTPSRRSSNRQRTQARLARVSRGAVQFASTSRGRHLAPRRSWLAVTRQLAGKWRRKITIRQPTRTTRPPSQEAWDV